MKQPDLLIFMSDQHSPEFSGWGPVKTDTPCLDELRRQGTSFEAAYTSCPLCVPARMSMMSSLLPSRTGIYGNFDAVPDTTPCFTHALVEAGYETVLIGRMHFVGKDQRHGFTKRLAPDITPVSWGKPVKKLQRERGVLSFCTSEPYCTNYVGAGESQVMHYDEMVVKKALEYLEQNHEKPQFILVGTYGPHFPYITSRQLYEKYLDRVKMPDFFEPGKLPEYLKGFDVLNRRVKGEEVTWEITKGALGAYCGLVEIMDGQIGRVKKAFDAYASRKGSRAVFGYLSDHGDMVGERRMFGKQTYFEKSTRIPLLFAGAGIPEGKVIKEPVSIMDLGPTVCELGGTGFEIGDGRSLVSYMNGNPDKDRIVASQFVEAWKGRLYASMMLRYQNYKYIRYHHYKGHDLLFDLGQDSKESVNLANSKPGLAAWFAKQMEEIADFTQMEEDKKIHDRNAQWFRAYETAVGYDDTERWQDNPETAKGQLEVAAAKLPIPFDENGNSIGGS